jgi:hypothetical protein
MALGCSPAAISQEAWVWRRPDRNDNCPPPDPPEGTSSQEPALVGGPDHLIDRGFGNLGVAETLPGVQKQDLTITVRQVGDSAGNPRPQLPCDYLVHAVADRIEARRRDPAFQERIRSIIEQNQRVFERPAE